MTRPHHPPPPLPRGAPNKHQLALWVERWHAFARQTPGIIPSSHTIMRWPFPGLDERVGTYHDRCQLRDVLFCGGDWGASFCKRVTNAYGRLQVCSAGPSSCAGFNTHCTMPTATYRHHFRHVPTLYLPQTCFRHALLPAGMERSPGPRDLTLPSNSAQRGHVMLTVCRCEPFKLTLR